jgi:hypothetical protein
MKKSVIQYLLLALVIFLPVLSAQAGVNQFGFDESLHYDIYYAGPYSDTSIVRDVTIKDVKEIGGKTFLVVRAYGFKLNEEDGFILLDSVVAILPQGNFTVRDVPSTKTRH